MKDTALRSAGKDAGGYDTFVASEYQAPSIEDASWLSSLFFSYTYPILEVGNKKQLNLEDLSQVPSKYLVKPTLDRFVPNLERANGSIPIAIFYSYGWTLGLSIAASLFTAGVVVFAPAVLHHVVDAFAQPTLDVPDLALWLGIFLLVRLINAFVVPRCIFYLEIVAFQVMVSVRGLIFRKSLRCNTAAKSASDVADVNNLYTSDVETMLQAAFFLGQVLVLPMQIIFITVMLYNVIGVASFAGLSIMLLSMFVGFLVAKYTGEAYADIMNKKDVRNKAIKEAFTSIQIVKLNAWENKIEQKILDAREKELTAIRRFLYSIALSIFILWSSPLFVSITTFYVYALVLNLPLTAAKVFTAMALFDSLREPMRMLPSAIQMMIQSKVSVDRISKFLAMEEYDQSNVDREDPSQPSDVAVSIQDGTFGWGKEGDKPQLEGVNLTIKKGDLAVVHGAVGSGKSSLCSALLGEMRKVSGKVFVRGSVAYYSQEAWIQNMTLRENILFGLPYDADRYNQVVEACGLRPDLDQLPAGDSTEIGQKGVNLSGGQKARVSLARACYSDADVFILDTPLAAVDAVVKKKLFRECLCGILEKKTIVLVTHTMEVIESEAANCKILLQDNRVTASRSDLEHRRSHYLSPTPPSSSVSVRSEADGEVESSPPSGQFTVEEEREDGRVSKEVFLQFFHAVGGFKLAIVMGLILGLWQAFKIGSDLWMSHWTDENLTADEPTETLYNMQIYALLGFAASCMVAARSFATAFAQLHSGKRLFEHMTHSLLHAPLAFFDSNPIGRILTRYSDDISQIDLSLLFEFGSLLASGSVSIFQLVTALYIIQYVGIFIIPITYVYLKIGQFFLAPSREISRLMRTTTSPALSYCSQADEGSAVIRAYGKDCADRTIMAGDKLMEKNSRAWIGSVIVNVWFEMRMQFISCGVIILVLSGLFFLRGILSPGLVGVAFTYALSVDQGLGELVQRWAHIEISMVCPERVLEYASIEPEGSEKALVIDPPVEWPTNGDIQFQDVQFSYKKDGPKVLKGLSFDIRHKEKIGIVGRTGAGKSSLTMALFRINELSGGRIVIDNKDISTMPLPSLRSKLSIIPQNPVLFKGTLRGYMDPFAEFTDAEIWEALHKVEMGGKVDGLEGGLSFELTENGENFSVGERQMLCMARALLTKAKIVVMDEATAAIDQTTERKLQEVVNRDFEDATVLTIAHRLATVVECDRIMVLSEGRVVEFASPKELVKDTNGVFYQLAQEGGILETLEE